MCLTAKQLIIDPKGHFNSAVVSETIGDIIRLYRRVV